MIIFLKVTHENISQRNYYNNQFILRKLPVKSNRRIAILDIFRGFAVFGILVVNIRIMNSSILYQDEFLGGWKSDIDLLTERIMQLFFYTKFFPIFSLLFGLGISIQTLKFIDDKRESNHFLYRRMFILLIIGILHILFLWSGDVLHIYSLIGFLSIFIIKKSNTWILFITGLLFFFPFYESIVEFIINIIGFKPEYYASYFSHDSLTMLMRKGNHDELLKVRVYEYLASIPMILNVLVPIASAMFLLGLYLGKNKIFDCFDILIEKTKYPFLILLITTNIYRIFFLFVIIDKPIFANGVWRNVLLKVMLISDVIMGLFYLWIIGYIWFFTNYKWLLKPFQFVGRMALTNYIMQSIIGLILFTSCGLGMYEVAGPFQLFLLSLLIFMLQVIYSWFWLKNFRYGPLEWVWRCLSYGTILSIKK